MKIFIFLLAALYSCNICDAQKNSWAFLIEASTAASNFSGRDAQSFTQLVPFISSETKPVATYYADDEGRHFKVGYNIGAGIQKQISPSFSLQFYAVISLQGAKTNLLNQPAVRAPGPGFYYYYALSGSGESTLYLTYLRFPLSLQFFPLKKKNIYFSAGIYYARLLHAKQRGHFSGYYYDGNASQGNATNFHYSSRVNYRKNDVGFQTGMGYNLPVLQKRNLWIDALYSRNIKTDGRTYRIPNTQKFYNQFFSLGLSYHFGI